MIFTKKQDTPEIEFSCREDLLEILPHPKPAVKLMPEWLRKIKPTVEGSPTVAGGTIKRCIPVLDAVSQGWIIPLWADLVVNIGETVDKETKIKRKTIKAAMSSHYGMGDPIGSHSWQQVGDLCDLKKYRWGMSLMKFTNPWVITTPPGWSVQIKNPANNFSNDIHLLEGVVDTDDYYNEINFPFVWAGSEDGEFIIPAGTPLVHVIPFKRTETAMKVTATDKQKKHTLVSKLGRYFYDRYKRISWHNRDKHL